MKRPSARKRAAPLKGRPINWKVVGRPFDANPHGIVTGESPS
jgi:hypothetical protein